VGVGLEDAEAVVVVEGEALQCVAGSNVSADKCEYRPLGDAGANQESLLAVDCSDQFASRSPVHPPPLKLIAASRIRFVRVFRPLLKIG
jgi:hypothetical protein